MYKEKFKGVSDKNSNGYGALEFLKGMSDKDDMMFWKHITDENGMLQYLFWCNGVSCMGSFLFDDVLMFDATYSKNKVNTHVVIFYRVKHHNQSIIFRIVIVGDETGETYV